MIYTPRSKVTTGFTMIELLVVIAIISILASMLLPALARARDQVRTINCANNLKTIGMAMSFYAGDYDEFLPPNATHPGQGGSSSWWGWWQHYLLEGQDIDRPPYSSTVIKSPGYIPADARKILLHPPDTAAHNLGYWYMGYGRITLGATNLSRITQPERDVHVADSRTLNDPLPHNATWTRGGFMRRDLTNFYPKHVGNRGNIVFIDGHVSSHGVEILNITDIWAFQ